ncbi:uncharacterized protein [Medicago truncatula]|nr:uncharacterized protein LOC11406148 isoform X1 [Medicago truncatula]
MSPISWLKSLVQSIMTMLKNFLLTLFYMILVMSAAFAGLVWGGYISATIRPYFLWADLLFFEQAALGLLRVEVHVLSYCGILHFLRGTIGQEEMDIVVGAIAVVISVVFAPTLIFPIEYVRIQIRWMPYHGIFHCITQTFQEGGVLRFYTGFADHYSRIAPYLAMVAILTFFLEDDCCSWSPSRVIKSIVKYIPFV